MKKEMLMRDFIEELITTLREKVEELEKSEEARIIEEFEEIRKSNQKEE